MHEVSNNISMWSYARPYVAASSCKNTFKADQRPISAVAAEKKQFTTLPRKNHLIFFLSEVLTIPISLDRCIDTQISRKSICRQATQKLRRKKG